MWRRLFFFFERIQITRNERLAIGVLLICLIFLSGLNLFMEKKAVYDPEYYEELERIFGERSRQAYREQEEILARYQLPDDADLPRISTLLPEPLYPPGSEAVADSGRGREGNRDEAARGSADTLSAEGTLVTDSTVLNINTAGKEELQQLPGIGPVYAERIIAWREAYGPFESVSQLIEIQGIGERRLSVIRSLVYAGETEEDL